MFFVLLGTFFIFPFHFPDVQRGETFAVFFAQKQLYKLLKNLQTAANAIPLQSFHWVAL